MLSRRKFLTIIVPGLAVSSVGFLYGSASAGSCPLSNEGYCVGPCSAFRDPNGDNICDRLPLISDSEIAADLPAEASPTVPAAAMATATPTATAVARATAADQTRPTQAPTQPPTSAPTQRSIQSPTPRPTATQPAQTTRRVACPYGLVNDRYPGRCRRYTDRNGNGICDLSEPQG